MPLLQETRLLSISTPLGPDALGARTVTIDEQLGRPFKIEAELSSEDDGVEFERVVGHNATLSLMLRDGGVRFFNGFVSRFTQIAGEGRLAHYRATIVPWLWFLTRTADCRVFQDKNVAEIIEDVFRRHGFDDYLLKLSNVYPRRDYCVQYRETDFNFVARLLEEEGIYTCYRHEDGHHKLVLADSPSAHGPGHGCAELPYDWGARAGHAFDAIYDWTTEMEVQPVGYSLSDFDYRKPKTQLLTTSCVTRRHGAAHFEIFDSPGEFCDYDEGTRRADLRLQELQAQHEIVRGVSNCGGLATGCTFRLRGHPRADQNREYLITSTSILVEQGDYASGGRNGDDGSGLQCHFTALPAERPFRASRVTPRPVVQGPQTAIVVAGDGEDILTDELGRVKVRFHWDRQDRRDEDRSCWIRVSQNAAGKGWGLVTTPRKGQEVIVDFIEGNPDRPIITGRVYNAECRPPYPLPANKSIFALKSNSTGTGQGFNEIRLEDRKGEEQLFLHAERNHDLRIRNDSFETVGRDRHLVVGNDQVERVKNDRSVTVERDHIQAIGRDLHQKVGGKEARDVGGSLSLVVKGNAIEVFQENRSQQVTKDYSLKADTIVIEAATNLTLKVGRTFIAIEAGGITISAPDLELLAKSSLTARGGSSVGIESSGPTEVKGSTTLVKGDGILTLNGGAVMIN